MTSCSQTDETPPSDEGGGIPDPNTQYDAWLAWCRERQAAYEAHRSAYRAERRIPSLKDGVRSAGRPK